MGSRGPAPKPTALRLLAGNPGKRPVNLAEPIPDPSAGNPPDWLGDGARRIWFGLAPRMARARLMGDVDETSLGRYCTILARWIECKTLVEQGKTHVPIKNRNGDVVGVKELPAAAEFRRLGPQLTQLEREFGMTPASRTRIRLENEKDAAKDPDALRARLRPKFWRPDSPVPLMRTSPASPAPRSNAATTPAS